MSQPGDASAGHGHHRARPRPVRVATSSALAVLIVAAVVAVLVVVAGNAPRPDDPPRAADAADFLTATPTHSAGPTRSTASTASTAPTASTRAAPGRARRTHASSPTATSVLPTIPVAVLNETTRRGLAAGVAAALEARGWRVSGTGNFVGNVPATTVYYPSGSRAAARVLARHEGTDRLRPSFPGIRRDVLTLILAKDYADLRP